MIQELKCLEEDFVLWKESICIPLVPQPEILPMLHDGHPGITAMESLVKLYLYWTHCNIDIAQETKKCSFC